MIVAYLLSMGANPELLTDEGDNALDLAGSEQVCMKTYKGVNVWIVVQHSLLCVFCSLGDDSADQSCCIEMAVLNCCLKLLNLT